jgi:flagellar biosynthesis/type III secretory pathway protein FliH
MKRLSMHIAEQLVLAELNLSGSSIERLIQRCLDELSNRSEPSIIVELNIQDKDRLEELSGEVSGHVQLRAVPGLQVGSVRVISDDTQVDDLITHRLEGMAHSLLGQPEVWREKSPFFRQPLAQRDSDVQDVKQRITASDDSFVENFND